jgi:hypothetical protein
MSMDFKMGRILVKKSSQHRACLVQEDMLPSNNDAKV